MKRDRRGEGLGALRRELGGDGDSGIAFLRDQVARLDFEGERKALDPGDGELARAGFEPADGDGGGGRFTPRCDIRQSVTPGFADLAEATHHFLSSGYEMSYRDTIMAK